MKILTYRLAASWGTADYTVEPVIGLGRRAIATVVASSDSKVIVDTEPFMGLRTHHPLAIAWTDWPEHLGLKDLPFATTEAIDSVDHFQNFTAIGLCFAKEKKMLSTVEKEGLTKVNECSVCHTSIFNSLVSLVYILLCWKEYLSSLILIY